MNLQLNSFDAEARRAALRRYGDGSQLAGQAAAAAGPVVARRQRSQRRHAAGAVNMHCHTFFSYNAYGHSPSSLAWLARQQGFAAAGIVDFDVLDGVDEFLDACSVVGVAGAAGLETRVYVPELAAVEINSPGEPGIAYHMGIGFTSGHVADPGAAAILAAMRERSARRNREMLARLNAHLAPVAVDYERDVLPLTPAGNATERHMLAAIIKATEGGPAAAVQVEGPGAGRGDPCGRPGQAHAGGQAQDLPLPDFWAARLGLPVAEVAAALPDSARFSNLVRGRLMKRGGVGYVPPSPEAFPTVEEFHKLIHACGALPCLAWLDGTSAGEQAIRELLALWIGKGVVAVNIIPDRNWNIADPETKRLKLARLYEIVALAAELDLPLNVGTEMNSPGNKLVDDFDAPELEPVRGAFLDGAHFICGHTILQRALGLGYASPWAERHLPGRRERNAFYTAVGYRSAADVLPPLQPQRMLLRRVNASLSPAEVLTALS